MTVGINHHETFIVTGNQDKLFITIVIFLPSYVLS